MNDEGGTILTPAERIALAVLESSASAYHATGPTQFYARAKVVASAARAIQPHLDKMLAEHAEAICTENPT